MTVIQPVIAVPPQLTVDPVGPAADRTHRLRVDQVVQATVAEGGLERVLLQLKNRRFWADTRVPLKTGQSLHLLVQETDPQISLRIIDDQLILRLRQALRFLDMRWDVSGQLRAIRDDPADWRKNQAENSRRRLDSVIGDLETDPEHLTGDILKRIRTRLGLGRDSDMPGKSPDGSLRPVLLEILETLRQSDREIPVPFRDLRGCIELLQISQACLARDRVLFLPLPFPFLERGYALIEASGKDTEDDPAEAGGSRLFSLHLRVSALGDLTIRLLQENSGLSVRFECASAETADFMAGFRGDLEHAMEAVPLRALSFAEGARSPEQVLVERLFGEDSSILDAMV